MDIDKIRRICAFRLLTIHVHSHYLLAKFASIKFTLLLHQALRLKSYALLIDLSNFCNSLNNSNNTNGTAYKVCVIIMEITVVKELYDRIFYRST